MARNRDNTINHIRQAMAGIAKHFATNSTLVLDGTTTATKDVVATLQGAIDAIDAAAAASKAFHDATAAQHAAIAKGNTLLTALKTLVTNQLGSAGSAFGDFGFTNPKRTVPDATTKVVAVAKRTATRAARHTMGPVQKKSVKGAVNVAVTVTPTAAPTPVASSPAVSAPVTGTGGGTPPRTP